VPLRLYKAIKEDDPIKAGRIIRELKKIRVVAINLVLKVAVGHPELERELTAEVLKDMDHLKTITDAYFIENVFSQFLHNEYRLPVSIALKAFSTRDGEPRWEPNFDELSSGVQE